MPHQHRQLFVETYAPSAYPVVVSVSDNRATDEWIDYSGYDAQFFAMNPQLHLRLLGAPSLIFDKGPVTGFRSSKAQALLYYLAATKRAHTRSALAGLLWGDVAEQHARRSLTTTLSNLRQLVGDYVTTTRDTIAFAHTDASWLDVDLFTAESAVNDVESLERAVALYRGDFLEGFFVSDAPGFEQWMLIERTHYRAMLLHTLDLLANLQAEQNNLPDAIESLRRLLAVESWREETHRQLMLLLAQNGQRAVALAQYELCRQILSAELDIEPDEETEALVAEIRAGEIEKVMNRHALAGAAVAEHPKVSGSSIEQRLVENDPQGRLITTVEQAGSSPKNHHLPIASTPFIGRKQELAEILQRIQDPTCRLLTLIGPGGMGKTRLALEAAARYATDENLAACFVNLQPLESGTLVAVTIADALDIHLAGTEPPRQLLLRYLQSQKLLLVLDNLEQLLLTQGESRPPMNDTLTFLSELLSVAPDVKLLVTSRVALNLQEEWLYFLGGMLSSNGGQANDLSQSSAVELFVDRARRVRPDFSHAAEERDIVRICQLVEGMPLSLELAASWTKVLSCAEIAAEIERNIDFLVATLRDIPARHRNMQAIFDQSWRLLTEEERTVFARLSIFRGGFRRAAAEGVAGASLSLLSALVDQSLLRCEPDGRYQIHEVLRQHAYPHLNASPHAATEVNSRHAHYYEGFLQRCMPNITGEEGPQIAREINAEIENIRQAWEWACTTGNSDMLARMTDPLQYFFDFRGRSPEFIGMLQQALAHMQEIESVEPSYGSLALLQTCLGWSYIRVGQLATARAVMEQAQALLEQHDLLPPAVLASDPLCGLGVIANSQGDYAKAHQFGIQAYERSIARNDLGNAQLARYVQANALYNFGIYEQAQIAALDGLHIARKSGALWFEAYLLNELGQIANALGEMARAHDYYEESRRIKAHFGDAEGMAIASINLARIALLTGEYAQAEALYSQCVVTYREIGDRGGLARALHGLGDILMAVARYPSAQQHFHDALQIAADMEFWPVTLTILTSISQLYLNNNRHPRARQLLSIIVEHPAGVGETQERASALLAGIEGHADDIDRGTNAAPMPDAMLVETITYLLAEMAMDIRQAAPSADNPALAHGSTAH